MSDNNGVIICPHCKAMLTLSVSATMKDRQEKADVSDLKDVLAKINDENLDDVEFAFVKKMRAAKFTPTIKQMKWLRDIAKKGF